MTYVITSPCVGCLDSACVDACPVDCITGPVPIDDLRAIPPGERGLRLPGVQLFIDPDACICCGACVPRCPVGAIFAEDDVPPDEQGSLERAREFYARGAP